MMMMIVDTQYDRNNSQEESNKNGHDFVVFLSCSTMLFSCRRLLPGQTAGTRTTTAFSMVVFTLWGAQLGDRCGRQRRKRKFVVLMVILNPLIISSLPGVAALWSDYSFTVFRRAVNLFACTSFFWLVLFVLAVKMSQINLIGPKISH